MKASLAALIAVSLGIAACNNSSSTAPTQARSAVTATPPSAPSVAEGTPPARAAAKCSQGITSQQGGGTDYLNCLNKQENK